jgi:putative phage-type endonuclease
MDKTLRDLRRQGIGGSDIAAILGVNPYRSAHDVWLEKVGYTEPADDPPSEAAYWGQQIEDILAAEYAKRENVRLLHVPTANGIVISPTEEWVMGSPDRLVDAAPLVGLELKMAGLRQAGRWGEPGTDQIPEGYLLQVQWYARLTEAVRWDLAVLLGQEFRIYRVNPHPDLHQALHDIAARFWFDHVVPKVAPEIDHSEGARRLMHTVFPIQQDEIRPATDEEVLLAHDLRTASRELERFALVQAKLRNLLCSHIGFAEGIAGADFRLVWKRTKDGRVTNWEAVARRAMERMPGEMQAEIIAEHSTTRPGVRRFRATFNDQEEAGTDAY